MIKEIEKVCSLIFSFPRNMSFCKKLALLRHVELMGETPYFIFLFGCLDLMILLPFVRTWNFFLVKNMFSNCF